MTLICQWVCHSRRTREPNTKFIIWFLLAQCLHISCPFIIISSDISFAELGTRPLLSLSQNLHHPLLTCSYLSFLRSYLYHSCPLVTCRLMSSPSDFATRTIYRRISEKHKGMWLLDAHGWQVHIHGPWVTLVQHLYSIFCLNFKNSTVILIENVGHQGKTSLEWCLRGCQRKTDNSISSCTTHRLFLYISLWAHLSRNRTSTEGLCQPHAAKWKLFTISTLHSTCYMAFAYRSVVTTHCVMV